MTVVAFEKTERGVACDESFYVKHKVYDMVTVYVIHVRPPRPHTTGWLK